MKKLLLVAAATAALSTSAMAEVGGFYLRADAGAFLNTKQTESANAYTLKVKSKAAGILGLGVGYNVTEDFRAEVVYGHVFNSEMKKSAPADVHTVAIKNKSKIDALMVKGVFDAYDFGAGKLFVTAGVGLSQVSNKGKLTVDGVEILSFKGKKKNNFAYTVGFGSSFNLAEGVNLDVQYNWADFGKSKALTVDGEKISNSPKNRGHIVTAGVRFDI